MGDYLRLTSIAAARFRRRRSNLGAGREAARVAVSQLAEIVRRVGGLWTRVALWFGRYRVLEKSVDGIEDRGEVPTFLAGLGRVCHPIEVKIL